LSSIEIFSAGSAAPADNAVASNKKTHLFIRQKMRQKRLKVKELARGDARPTGLSNCSAAWRLKRSKNFCRIPVGGGDMLVEMTTSDLDLLRRFIRDHAQDAFTELVQRHVNLVYSAVALFTPASFAAIRAVVSATKCFRSFRCLLSLIRLLFMPPLDNPFPIFALSREDPNY
jgi:hypothetical protein